NDTITRSDVVIRKYLDNIFYGGIGSVKFNYETLKATVGGGWNRYDGDHFGEITWAQNSIGTFTTNHEFYRNTGVKDDANAYARINYMATNALYLYADIQYRHINYKVNGFDDDMRDLTQKHEYDFVNPKIGIFLQPSENISAYLNLAKANREPNRTTLIDADPNKPEPKHEELYNAELGGSIMSEKWSIKANSYLMYYYDQLVLTGNINDVGSAIMENVDKSYRTGIEVMWGIAPTDWLKWTGNMTFSQNKILNFTSYTDNWDTWGQEIEEHGTTDISFSPEIITNSNIELKPLENLSVNFITQYVGEQYIDNTSNEDRKLDAYLVNNLRIDYSVETSWWKDATIYLQVNNIFDNEYITNAWIYPFYYGDELNKLDGYYPQAGINFMAGLNLHF
ncbi:MAG: TonB-dependent receptor, partial [Salinivirgaceae bacterium]